jgi:leucine efflux protein
MFGNMFGITNYSAFVIAFILLLLLPGPGNLALITSTSKGGVKGGLAATFGVMLGDQVLLWFAVAGVAALLRTYPQAFQAVQLLGAAYLAWLGFKLLLAKPGDQPILNIRPRHYFYQALVITLLNPKAIVFYMAFFPLFIDPVRSQGLVTYAAMSATILTLAFIYCVTVVLISHFMAERIRSNPLATSVLQKLAGVFLIGFGVKLALSK